VAKKKKKTTLDFKTVLVYLAILFTGILFIVKLFSKSLGWLDVFAPLLVAFCIIFLLSVVKLLIKKI